MFISVDKPAIKFLGKNLKNVLKIISGLGIYR